MRGLGLEPRFLSVPLLVGSSSLASLGCLPEMWPNDEVSEPALDTCLSTRRAPGVEGSENGRERIAIDGTNQELLLADVDAEGRGNYFVGTVRLEHGVGAIELGCQTLALAVYTRRIVSGSAYFYALAVKNDRFYDIVIGCENAMLADVWYQGTDGIQQTYESLTGSCSEIALPKSSLVVLPALDMPVPSHTITGWTIDGPEISLASDGTGRMVLDSVEYQMIALAETRCSTDCETQDWGQLDSLLWDRAGRRVMYSLVDLRTPDEVTVMPRLSLPGFVYDAEWRPLTATFTMP